MNSEAARVPPIRREARACVLAREAMVPPGAAAVYLLMPPFLTLLLTPQILSRGDWAQFWPNLGASYIHCLVIGSLLHALYLWVVPRIFDETSRWPIRALTHGGAIGLAVTAGLMISFPLTRVICVDRTYGLAYELYVALLLASVLVGVAVAFQRLRKRALEVELRAERAYAAAVRAELATLQARTDPHFLFNSLNTVAGLIGRDPELAEATVERLADVFRYCLDASRRERVDLSAELEAVRDYLEVEALRLGERLAWELEVEPGLEAVSVPPLLLHPLVENAVRHAAATQVEGARIAVSVSALDGGETLQMSVSDDGPGPGRSSHRGTATSLSDLRERLAMACGPTASFELSAREGGGACAVVRLPIAS